MRAKTHYTSLQDVFNVAWLGLKDQRFVQSVGSTGGCRYRGRLGTRCAIGHCIPDAIYTPAFEGDTIARPGNALKHYLSTAMAGIDPNDLSDLQQAHDMSANRLNMERAMRGFAERHNLNIPGDDPAAKPEAGHI